ncbi:MAG: hypothetical protein E7310_08590 [Clostridiales bacterium]|nr:hypothetical protein [Clostridiales bacterium]
MYEIIKIVVILFALVGILYLFRLKAKYKNEGAATRDEIIAYFKEKEATSIETGIRIKDLPLNISRNNYLLMMVKDNTLSFKKGKYYLNDNGETLNK